MRSWLPRLLSRSGMQSLWQWRQQHKIPILTIHGVSDPSTSVAWHPLRQRLTLARLDFALDVLRQHYTFVSLADAVDMLAGRRPVRPHAMAVTFDDGYQTQVTGAGPVLEKHGVPATVFVSTGFVESRRPFWFDRLDYALQHGGDMPDGVTLAGETVPIARGDRQALAASYSTLRERAKAAFDDDREMARALDQLAVSLERGRRGLAAIADKDPWSRVLTAEEIRAASGGFEFGSHTVHHLRMHRLPVEEVRRELVASKQAIEQWTGRPCRFFCYPDGGWSPEAARLVAECGYEAAVTTDRGLNATGADLMTLKRIDVPLEGPREDLLARVSGLVDALRRVG